MAATEKVCSVCGKDVRQSARVKDARGRYYCPKCQLEKKAAKAPAAAAGDGDLDLAPLAVQAAPQPRRSMLMTQPATVSPAAAKSGVATTEPEAAARVGTMVASLMKWGFYLAIVGFLIFSGYGLYLMFGAPKGAFDDYPKTHVALIKEFLADVSQGTDKAYDKAYLLISFRARLSNNPDEIGFYKKQFAQIHDAMVAKHGANWINSVDVSSKGIDVGGMDDGTMYAVTIGGTEYHITTQVQIAVDQMIGNLPGNIRSRQVYPEDGKNHFGVIEMDEFPVDWRRKPGEPIPAPGGPGLPPDNGPVPGDAGN